MANVGFLRCIEVVFGSGLQAYWHVRLALLFRGHTIRHVHIINRRFSENAKDILKKFHVVPQTVKEREGWESAKFSLLTPGYGDYARLQVCTPVPLSTSRQIMSGYGDETLANMCFGFRT